MIDQALIELLKPIVREIVREELREERQRQRFVTVRQAAELLDTTEQAIRHRASRGQLPTVKLDGRRYIDMQALDAMLQDAVP